VSGDRTKTLVSARMRACVISRAERVDFSNTSDRVGMPPPPTLAGR
jgi:hypothetical protein